MLSFKDRFEQKSAIGTTFGSINKDELYNLPIVKPSTEIIKLFEDQCKPIFDQQMNLGNEILSLTKQRDELLPLLMNGQVNFDLSANIHTFICISIKNILPLQKI
jgi:type I restriction enzyme S subunit